MHKIYYLIYLLIIGIKYSNNVENFTIKLNEQCYEDEECISGYCRRSIFIFIKYSKGPISMSSPVQILKQHFFAEGNSFINKI